MRNKQKKEDISIKEDIKSKEKGFDKKPKFGNKFSKPNKLCMNDPNWYVIHPDLLKDVATLPFSHWLGDSLPLYYTSNSSVAIEATVLKLLYTYSLGVSSSANDPVNLAIRNLYTYVRHQNSGHANYEPADLGMYLLATGGLIATLAHIERCLGVIKLYQRRSRVVPQQLCDALGVNLPNAAANLANYTARLNVLWQRVSSLCIPKDFKFIQRWIWMNSQVFKDHESDKAALIVFKPIGVPKFDSTSSSRGGIIKQYTAENSTPDLINWFIDAEALADAILEDEDMNIMSGDILKAYGFENLMTFGMTSLDYVVEPVYVEEMLPQVQHAMTLVEFHVPASVTQDAPRTGINYDVAAIINDQTDSLYAIAQDDDFFTIYQVDGVVVCTPCQKGKATAATVDTSTGALYWAHLVTDLDITAATDQKIISSYKTDVPPEDVIISTRLMYTEKADSRVAGTPVFFESCGTEIVGRMTLYCAYKNASGVIGKTSIDFGTIIQLEANGYGSTDANVLCALSQVDWAPFLYYNSYSSGTVVRNCNFFGDIDNFTALYPQTLAMMHTNAILAEFNVTKYNLVR